MLKNFFDLSSITFRISHDGGIVAGKSLEETVSKFVGNLTLVGIGRGEIVGILSENSIDFVISIFALWRIGSIPMPISTRLTDAEISTVLSSVPCSTMLTDLSNASRNITNKVRSFSFMELSKQNTKKVSDTIERSKDETAVVILTSGSTGMPKGVQLTFKNLVQSALAGDEFFQHRTEDKWLASLPFYHIGGFSVITRSLLFGTELVIPTDLNQDTISYYIEKYHPTFASFVPTQLKRFLERNSPLKLPLRRVLLGGGFIDSELVRNAIKAGWPVAKSYGSSETASFIAVLPPEHFDEKPESAGAPLRGNKIYIVDDKKNILGPNESGEIAVEGPSVAKGYVNDDALTASKFRKGIYYTGDYGYIDNDGYLYVTARKDEFIISGGEKVNPREVEAAILSHPQVEDAAVLGLKDPEWGQVVTAVVVPKQRTKITLTDLKEFLRKSLAPYKHPRKLFMVKSIPRTPLGKVKMKELEKILTDKEKFSSA